MQQLVKYSNSITSLHVITYIHIYKTYKIKQKIFDFSKSCWRAVHLANFSEEVVHIKFFGLVSVPQVKYLPLLLLKRLRWSLFSLSSATICA